MIHTSGTTVRERQDPLMRHFQQNPADAVIEDRAKTVFDLTHDPFHGRVSIGREDLDVSIPFGIHHAVGGYHDAPNPGDLLCAALAACLDSTIRIIAQRLKIQLHKLEIEVIAKADVRGTLMVNKDVPVGFQGINCLMNIEPAKDTHPESLHKLIAMSEYCCVNLQTLSTSVDIVSQRI